MTTSVRYKKIEMKGFDHECRSPDETKTDLYKIFKITFFKYPS